MIPNRNASDVRKGFNYQDMVALFYFLNNIREIKEIKNEGKDDIDVKLKNNSIKYFQVKETKDINHALDKEVLKKALNTLFDDTLDKNNKKVSEIGIITNCNYPFTMQDKNFLEPYISEDYTQLSSVAKKRISDALKELFTDDSNYDTKKFNYKKLTIKKIAYHGNDDASKLERLERPINKFLDVANIERSKYFSLLRDWSYIFYRNSEQTYTITPQKFVRRTEVTILDNPNLDEFFRTFHIRTGNKSYIKNKYSDYLEKMYTDFRLMSLIQRDYIKYGLEHPDEFDDELETNFVNEEAGVIFKELGLTNAKANIDIAKLIVWLRITHDVYFENIESAAGIESN